VKSEPTVKREDSGKALGSQALKITKPASMKEGRH
jgi:hypothetical protein